MTQDADMYLLQYRGDAGEHWRAITLLFSTPDQAHEYAMSDNSGFYTHSSVKGPSMQLRQWRIVRIPKEVWVAFIKGSPMPWGVFSVDPRPQWYSNTEEWSVVRYTIAPTQPPAPKRKAARERAEQLLAELPKIPPGIPLAVPGLKPAPKRKRRSKK